MATSHNREIITLLFILTISVPIQTQSPTLNPNTMVGCTVDHSCGGSPVTSTMKDCCDHDIEPSGFAYTIPGVDGCNLCPVDFGFSQSSFSGRERGESYRAQVKFFSGGITGTDGFLFSSSLELSGTASSSDVNLITTRGRFLSSDVLQPEDVEFSLSVDNIAQESNETFTIVLQLYSINQFGGANVNFRDRLEVIIIDSDVITFQLSNVNYTQNEEPNALMEVLITKESGIQLANPVYFRITPLTVDDALARGVISEFEAEKPFSPNRANYDDFNQSVLYVEFPSDRDSVEVTISIVDDDIDEADEQVFIIFLEVVNATNLDNLNILDNGRISVGRIRDDEIIRIGFECQSYEIIEPNSDDQIIISNLVYLIRENNQISEQTYSVDLTVGDPGGNYKPATIETSDNSENFDYSFGRVDQIKQNELFPPTVDRIPFVFSLNPDLSIEETETFRATSTPVISSDFPLFQASVFSTTLIHILDNDKLRVGFEELNYTISESAGTVEVCVVVISPPPTDDLNVTIVLSPSTINGTAGAGSDFTGLTEFLTVSLVFPSSPGSPTSGPRRECFNVTITNDDLLENTESFSLLLQEDIIFGSQTEAIIYPNRTDIFILDDDELIIGFEHTTYLVKEGNVVEVCAVLTGKIKRVLVFFVNSSNGSATAEDYNPVFETLTFGPTSNRTCFNFTTLEDEILEENIEDVHLHLSTMALKVILDPFLAHVHIRDDDGPTIDSNIIGNKFTIVVVAGAVVLLVVAIVFIVIVIKVALRHRHSTLDLQNNNKSEPLPAIKLSSITGEAEEDLGSHVYDDIYKYNKTNSQPTATHPPTLPPIPASRNGGYKFTTCPAYAPIGIKNIPIPASRNGAYELTTCPPTNFQNSPRRHNNIRLY